MNVIEIFSLLLYIGVALSLSNAWLSWNSRQAQARTYSLLLFCTAIWALFGAHELQSHSHQMQILWSSLAYLGSAWVGPLFFLTTIESSRSRFFPKKIILHFIIPFIILLLVATNPWHLSFYTHYDFLWLDGRPVTHYGHGWVFWFFIGLTYIYSAIATAIILYRVIHSQGQFFTRFLWIIAFTFPWIASFAYLLEWIPIPGLDPTPLAFTCTAVILTIAMRRQNFFDPNSAAHSSLLKSLSDGVLVFDDHGVLQDWNTHAKEMLGLELECGRTRSSQLPAALLDSGSSSSFTLNNRLYTQKNIPLGSANAPMGRLYLLHDMTDEVATETRIRLLSKAIESGPTAVVVTDLQGRIVYVNPRFCTLSGYAENDVLGKRPRFMKSDQNPPRMYKTIWEKIQSGQVWRGELLSKRKNGIQYWHRIDIAPINSANGEITHFVALTEDVTERKIMQRRLEEMASTDSLSGHFNRHFVLQMALKELARHRRNRRPLSVGIFELDNFRALNDTHGHEIGDQVITHFSIQLREFFREGDLIGRFDGDAFLLIFADTEIDFAFSICNRLQNLIKQKPVETAKGLVEYSFSIGIAHVQQHDTLESLIQRAEASLESAKKSGPAQIYLDTYSI